MKKLTYHHSHVKDSAKGPQREYTGETRDLYFAGGEAAPHVILGNIDNYGKQSTKSTFGYSETYSSRHEKTFGKN